MIECDDLDPHPVAYRTFLMVLSTMTPFLNAYAIFCIVKKSTKQMASYKWWLLIYQLASSAFDFVFTTLIVPILLFPTMMAYADSYLARWISLSTITGIRIFGSSLMLMLSTILNLFIYRCYVVIPQNHALKVCLRGPWLHAAILLICGAPTSIGLVDFVPDQMQARAKVLEEYSCAKTAINVPRLLILSRDRAYHIFIIGVTLDFFAALLVFCTISLSYYFLIKRNHMSRKTRLMQRRYLFSLCIQVSIPAITLFTPVVGFLIGWFALSVPIGQDAGNLGLSIAALHCLIAPLSLIFCNDTYRSYTINKLKYVCTRGKVSALNGITPSTLKVASC